MPTSEFTIEFGYKSDPNKGSNNNPHVFIDGVRLYKIGDTNYDEILKTELQNEVDILKAYSNDSRMSKYNSIKDEILNKCNEALKLSDISKIESMIQELKEYKRTLEAEENAQKQTTQPKAEELTKPPATSSVIPLLSNGL